MKKIKYKNQNNENYIKRIVVLLVLIFIFFLAYKALNNYVNKTQNMSADSLTTIKEVIEYYKSTYISEKENKSGDYNIDVKVKFLKLPYENDESNEEYYNNIIEGCARVLFYSKNFQLIDKENDITIQVICKNGKIASIMINGIEDYFIYMDSQISLKSYEEIPETEFIIESPVLQDCVNNFWNDGTVWFGERDSIFNGYDIYHDEGIRVRTICGKIYNIIFSTKYNGNIVNGIFAGVDNASIKANLGKPTFQDEENGVIGYKGKDFYVFFHNGEISIYRNTEENTEDFFKLADKFIAEEVDFLDFMNKLTDIWPDYSDYEYDSKFVFISYPLKGVEIKINYDDINGILVYNNIKAGLPTVGSYLKNTYFVSRLQVDLVFNAEKRRISSEEKMKDECLAFKQSLSEEDLKLIGDSLKYDIYPLKDDNGYIFSMRFISKNEDLPNRELNDGIQDFLWDGDKFIYSKRLKGIFMYDINTGIVSRLITGKDDFRIKSLENGVLKYDDMEIIIP